MKRVICAVLLPLALPTNLAIAKEPFPLMLAKSYDHQAVGGWLASEKLDGVRGFWDGENLRSRNGYIYEAPDGFTDHFPNFPLDGELYLGRGQFANISGKVRKGEDWDGIKYHVFDVPKEKGGLQQRLKILEKWLAENPNPNIIIVKQTPVADITEAQELQKVIEAQGGEGVMLRDPSTNYIATRTETLLKLKSHQDAECTVIAHLNGKGKYADKLGALVCQLADGSEIKLGSGFSDAERDNPPPIGSVVTFHYNGLTKHGKPRFARFWRIREKQ